MADLLQPETANNDGFYFHEAYVVWEIAFNEALSMQQNPGFVHLAGACLYRLRESDLTLAKELGITVYHLRNWAMENLPTTNSFARRYDGHIDFDYTIERRADKMHVRQVKKCDNGSPMPHPDQVHLPDEGLIVRERIDPAASEMWATAMMSTYEFAQEVYADSGDAESPVASGRRILLALLDTVEVRSCVENVGFSVGEMRGKLELVGLREDSPPS
ncbi:MAG: hypothetical protein O3A93_09180 [Chloroflexi bacterium]|nr:hypothetical protein [Chloroflexota bacterium]MDA1271419.1 hypothetical protein [Chloroflexota bacterium]PKB58956.1 MAG: hypothetical protein BZY83_04195 [SAR202 cluster bacterium Casp-Chloro-G2]